MTKSKEEKSNCLEMISIGKLYTGPWEKKYWSSSRGKDRYPYPIGYKTSRTLNGVTYKMEILEGLKGPLFTHGRAFRRKVVLGSSFFTGRGSHVRWCGVLWIQKCIFSEVTERIGSKCWWSYRIEFITI